MQPQTSKIIFAVIITAIVVGGGMYVWQQNDRQKLVQVVSTPAQVNTVPSQATTAPVVAGITAIKEMEAYENKDRGFSFEYPVKLGKTWENRSSDSKVISVGFMNGDDQSGDLQFYAQNSATPVALRACEDLLKNGFADGDLLPSGCETLTVDGHAVRVLTFTEGGMSNSSHPSSKQAMFETKNGVWNFAATKESSYDDFLSIVKTLKFL